MRALFGISPCVYDEVDDMGDDFSLSNVGAIATVERLDSKHWLAWRDASPGWREVALLSFSSSDGDGSDVFVHAGR